MSHPVFSVIIPTYNRSAHLLRTIESVLNQTERSFELIIVDDGSSDATKAVVGNFASDSRVKYICQSNQERGAARNHGASIATGEFLNFFDSDDYMYVNHLQAANAYLSNTRTADFFHTCYRVVDESGAVILEEMGVPDDTASTRLIETNYLSCDSVFVKREFFKKLQFNPDRRLASAEDWELWLRMISRTKLYRCEQITFEIRSHPGRSLTTINAERIAERDLTLLTSLRQDKHFVQKFKRDLRLFEANLYAFSALAFAVQKNDKIKTFHFLGKSLNSSIKILGRKRFWAAVKHLLL
ncbi:MAG: glycosyltransferase [Chryseolinea sp.]